MENTEASYSTFPFIQSNIANAQGMLSEKIEIAEGGIVESWHIALQAEKATGTCKIIMSSIKSLKDFVKINGSR